MPNCCNAGPSQQLVLQRSAINFFQIPSGDIEIDQAAMGRAE
jgi:hypothetical protein